MVDKAKTDFFQKRERKNEICLKDPDCLWDRILYFLDLYGISHEEFFANSSVDSQVYEGIKNNTKETTLKMVVTICVEIALDTSDAFTLLDTAGYTLNRKHLVQDAYWYILNHLNKSGIDACNEFLKGLGITQKRHLLGSQEGSVHKNRKK